MRIADVLWDPVNVNHIWDKHRVTSEEVNDVCLGHHLTYGTRSGRYVLFGKTSAGRYLKVVVEATGAGTVRPVTAFDMSESERRQYRRKGK